jgi:tryptophanyl-tRNA synthetase
MTDLEQQVSNCITEGLAAAVQARLQHGYGDNPLTKLIDSVVVSRTDEMRKILESSIDGTLKGDFKKQLQTAVQHKLARILVSKMEGEVERRVGELRSNPEFRAKVTLAVTQLVEEMVREQRAKG